MYNQRLKFPCPFFFFLEWMDQPVSEPLPASVGEADDDSFELIER